MFLGLADNIFVDTPSLGTPGLGWVLQSGGVQATLDIDFVVGRAIASGVISTPASLLTCARATPAAAYYQNADGTLSTFAANTLRFGSNGLFVEEQRINLCLQNQALNVTWGTSGATVSANSATAPDATVTADKVQEDGNNTVHLVNQTITVVATTAYTLTAYVKPSERTIFRMDPVEPAVANNPSYFSLVGNGSVLSNSVGNVGSIVALANGWYRCQITRTTSVGQVSMTVQIGPSDADYGAGSTGSYQGTTGNGLFAWGIQLEAGAFATSLIPTTTVAVTRAADGIIFSSIVGRIATGTWFISYTNQDISVTREVIDYSPIAPGSTLILYGTNGNNARISWDGGGLNLGAVSVGPTFKAAFNFDSVGNMAGCLNGGTVQFTAASDYTGAATQITIGSRANASSNLHDGFIPRIAFWNTKLSNAAMQSLTT